MKQTKWIGNIIVVPSDGPEGENKSIVLSDPDSGEVIEYVMNSGLQQLVARKLKQSNKALHLELVEAQTRAQAAAQLAPNGGAGGLPGDEALVREILSGNKDPRRGT